jgi:hypothetical protein
MVLSGTAVVLDTSRLQEEWEGSGRMWTMLIELKVIPSQELTAPPSLSLTKAIANTNHTLHPSEFRTSTAQPLTSSPQHCE